MKHTVSSAQVACVSSLVIVPVVYQAQHTSLLIRGVPALGGYAVGIQVLHCSIHQARSAPC